MFSPTAPESSRLADEFWLAAHDGGLGHRSTLSQVTRNLGLAGALLVEMIDIGCIQVSNGRPGSRHQPLSAEGETTLLHPVPGYERMRDPLLQQVYGIVGRNSDTPQNGNGYGYAQDPYAQQYSMMGSGIPVRNILEYLAIENRAEQLVINRLLTTGLVRYETRKRLFGADTKVIVPVNSVISGRALARIIAGLQPAQSYLRLPDADPNAPRGLSEFDKRMAALFAAAGVFEVDQTGLTGNEMRMLRAQLQTGMPPALTAVLRQVSLVIKSFALNR